MTSHRHRRLAGCLIALVLALSGTAQANPNGTLNVDLTGDGTGQVVGTGWINCPGVCSADLVNWFATSPGVPATLFAVPATGSIFAGWGEACAAWGTSTKCELHAFSDGPRTAVARFERIPILTSTALTVSLAGSGSGTVHGPGIDCPGDCAQGFIKDTMISVSATPAPGSSFDGWSGSCAGATATCDVTMSGARDLTATFTAGPPASGDTAASGSAPASGDTPGAPLGSSGDCTIRGTRGTDLLRGTPRRDVICGLGGSDTLVGRAGNDVLRGGAGADLLRGGRGRDVLNGGPGRDRARVESGRDTRKSIESVL
jgi:hypothetical protein